MKSENHARAREHPPAEEPQVIGVRLAGGNRRTPQALVKVQIGPAVVTFGYVRLRRGKWEVRPPTDCNNEVAIKLPPKLVKAVTAMVREAAERDEKIRQGLRFWW